MTRLAKCTLLAGDRAAAAKALNAYDSGWFSNPRGPDFSRALQYKFHDRVELTWPGLAPVTGSEQASRVWTESVGKSPFYITSAFGETADRV